MADPIASNISTEHFVGMAGSGFGVSGLAVASYEWIAAASLVFVGLWLLPRYLELGIYTMPEFLEHRFGVAARTLMAVYMMLAYVGVAMAAVPYSGALGLATIYRPRPGARHLADRSARGGVHDLRRTQGGGVVGPHPGRSAPGGR